MTAEDVIDNKTLFSNFEEVPTPIECDVKGTIPSWLHGALMRQGTGMFDFGNTTYNHWFDGLAYFQKYTFNDGKMTYMAKFLKGNSYTENTNANRIVVTEFGTASFPDPCKNIFSKFFNAFTTTEFESDNCNVNFLKVGDKIYATSEFPRIREIDATNLDTLELVNVDKYVALHSNTAHQQYDQEGNVYNIGSNFGKNGSFIFTKVPNPNLDKSKESNGFDSTETIGTIKLINSAKPPYYHSFGMTENYMVLIETPLRINVMQLLTRKVTGKAFRDTFEFLEDTLNVIHILDKRTGTKIGLKVQSDVFFAFHHANSYEDGDYLVLDFCSMKKPSTLEGLSVEQMRSDNIFGENDDFRSYLHRMVVPLTIPDDAKEGDDLLKNYHNKKRITCTAVLTQDGKVHLSPEKICTVPFEFPQINYAINTKNYKYCYGAVIQKDEPDNSAIVKANTTNNTFISWKKDKKSFFPTEPIFVAKPGSTEEDDGVLIVPIITNLKQGDLSFVVILDAKDLSEVARCYIPKQLPMGFHSMYLGGDLAFSKQ